MKEEKSAGLEFPALTKYSSTSLVKAYFVKLLNLSKSNDEFPVDLDDVWPLVYNSKGDAVKALIFSDSFVQDYDYKVFRQNPKNPQGGRPINKYMISIKCLEYFIVKKVRPVFEVYRQVFHKTVEAVGAAGQVDPSQLPGLDEALMAIMDKYPNIPQTYGEALMEAGRFFNEKESLKNKVIETTARANKAEALSVNLQSIISSNEHKVSFYDNVLKVDEGMVSLDEAAKRLSAFGINVNYKAFVSFLKEIKFLIKGKSGRFSLSANAIRKGYASYRVIESYVFGKKIPCNVIVMTDKGIVNLVEAIKGKLMDVFGKYGTIYED